MISCRRQGQLKLFAYWQNETEPTSAVAVELCQFACGGCGPFYIRELGHKHNIPVT